MITTPEPSALALIAQWRQQLNEYEAGSNKLSADEAGQLSSCTDELEAALKPLADLAAEMQRFAETQRDVFGRMSGNGAQALAWAARLQELQR